MRPPRSGLVLNMVPARDGEILFSHEICFVCKGFGTVRCDRLYSEVDEVCRYCSGKGTVVIERAA